MGPWPWHLRPCGGASSEIRRRGWTGDASIPWRLLVRLREGGAAPSRSSSSASLYLAVAHLPSTSPRAWTAVAGGRPGGQPALRGWRRQELFLPDGVDDGCFLARAHPSPADAVWLRRGQGIEGESPATMIPANLVRCEAARAEVAPGDRRSRASAVVCGCARAFLEWELRDLYCGYR
jgi:hypothetical protein